MRAADEICEKNIGTCYINGGSKTCDREKAKCPPCLAQMNSGIIGFFNPKYACHAQDDDDQCPEDTSDCSGALSRLYVLLELDAHV